ncbi:unnamed protein product [Bursaphelenchus okinawaensis]|uniref:Nuclear receptor domain-containing protein n=1 Tax=Bursaphelenchus okinawaensis TaxID=465554 RepID=A0A811KV58_9BILA|nr:unnamed protein product [Bursaphelenchus okinawaensis]CAG9113824.1 unnamed protein product [Bursaphelenchus okinawaensis]
MPKRLAKPERKASHCDCQVCGRPTRAYFHKLYVCCACTMFYRRNFRAFPRSQCRSGGSNCDLSNGPRRFCLYCRLNACRALGLRMLGKNLVVQTNGLPADDIAEEQLEEMEGRRGCEGDGGGFEDSEGYETSGVYATASVAYASHSEGTNHRKNSGMTSELSNNRKRSFEANKSYDFKTKGHKRLSTDSEDINHDTPRRKSSEMSKLGLENYHTYRSRAKLSLASLSDVSSSGTVYFELGNNQYVELYSDQTDQQSSEGLFQFGIETTEHQSLTKHQETHQNPKQSQELTQNEALELMSLPSTSSGYDSGYHNSSSGYCGSVRDSRLCYGSTYSSSGSSSNLQLQFAKNLHLNERKISCQTAESCSLSHVESAPNLQLLGSTVIRSDESDRDLDFLELPVIDLPLIRMITQAFRQLDDQQKFLSTMQRGSELFDHTCPAEDLIYCDRIQYEKLESKVIRISCSVLNNLMDNIQPNMDVNDKVNVIQNASVNLSLMHKVLCTVRQFPEMGQSLSSPFTGYYSDLNDLDAYLADVWNEKVDIVMRRFHADIYSSYTPCLEEAKFLNLHPVECAFWQYKDC